jgi:hypothetical protein
MSLQIAFWGVKTKKTPETNLMIGGAGVCGRAVSMWNIAGTFVGCQGTEDRG